MARWLAVSASFGLCIVVTAIACGPSPAGMSNTAPPPAKPPQAIAADPDAGQAPDAQTTQDASPGAAPSPESAPTAGAAAPANRAPGCRGRPPLNAGSDASTAPPEPTSGIDTNLSFSESRGQQGAPSSLFLNFTTRGHFGCLGYRIPVTFKKAGDVLRATLGAVQAPQGACPTALGPAKGSAPMPHDLNGTFTLEVARAGFTDRYELAISPSRLHVKPVRNKFSWIEQPSAWNRVPEDAAHIACMFQSSAPVCQKQLEGGGPDCETVFSDPVIAKYPPLEMKPGRYMPSWFDEPDGCYLRPPGGFTDLVTYLRGKYAGAFPCLQISVYGARGEALVLHPLPPGAQ